jgi:hypothetical protein
MTDAASMATGVPFGDLSTRKSGKPFRFVHPFLITNIVGNDEVRAAIQGIRVDTLKLVCRQCKQRSIPAPGTVSKDRKTCLCGDCERWGRLADGLRFDARWDDPDPSYFGITSKPSLEIKSELDEARPFEFEPKSSRHWTALRVTQLVWMDGKSQSEAEKIAQRELGRLLNDLNADAVRVASKADRELRRQWLREWREIPALGEAPELPRIKAGDKSASTRRTYEAMWAVKDQIDAHIAHVERCKALRDILSSLEFAGVFSRAEMELFQAWMTPWHDRPINRTATEYIWRWHVAWCGGRYGYSDVEALLDEDNPQSIQARFWRHWHKVECGGQVSRELSEAVRALLAREEPEQANVAEVNPRIFVAVDDDGDEFPLDVWAHPRFSAQTITHRNVEAAYADNSGLAAYQRERIECFAQTCKGADIHHDRLSSLRDRVRTPETLTLSYSQSGRGFSPAIAPGPESADLSDTTG